MFPEVVAPKPVQTFPVCAEGRAVLERANDELGLAFDDWDLDFYTKVRKRVLKKGVLYVVGCSTFKYLYEIKGCFLVVVVLSSPN